MDFLARLRLPWRRALHGSTLALSVGAALGVSTPVRADGDACLLGHWKGTLKEEGTGGPARLVPVFLDITSLEDDTDRGLAGSLRFQPPRDCRLSLSYAGAENATHYLTMLEPSGAACSKLMNIQIRLVCVGPTELKLSYAFPDANKALQTEQLTLSRVQPSTPRKKTP
jgi:hypothetical protein